MPARISPWKNAAYHCPPRPLRLACTDILCDKRGQRLRKGRRHQHDKRTDLLRHADSRGCNNAKTVYNRIDGQKRQTDQPVLQRNRQAHLHNPRNHAAPEPDISASERKRKPSFSNHKQTQNHAECLREHGRKRCSAGRHVKARHKNQIARHVKYARKQNRQKRSSRITDSAKDAAEHIISHNKHGSRRTDQHIPHRPRKCFLRRIQKNRKRLRGHHHQSCHSKRQHRKKADAASDNIARFFLLSAADCLSHQNGRSHGQTCDDRCHHVHHLTSGRNRRHIRRRSELSDYQQIDRSVQCLQTQRKQYRHGKAYQRLKNFPSVNVFFCSILFPQPRCSFEITIYGSPSASISSCVFPHGAQYRTSFTP